MGQATLSPGQLHRKETPPRQHGAGPVEPSSGGDVTDDMLPYPAFPAKSDPVAQSSSSILAIHPSHTHKHAKRMYAHTRKTLKATSRGPVDEAQQQCGFVCWGRSVSRWLWNKGRLFSGLKLRSCHIKEKVKERVQKNRLQQGIDFWSAYFMINFFCLGVGDDGFQCS